jgi:hypothetical protein
MRFEGSGALRRQIGAAGSLSAFGGEEGLPAGVALPREEAEFVGDDLLEKAFAFCSGGAFGSTFRAVGRAGSWHRS